VIPVRWIGEQHVREDLGFIPSFADWAKAIRPEPWMGRAVKLERAEPPSSGLRGSNSDYRETVRCESVGQSPSEAVPPPQRTSTLLYS